LPNLEHYGKSEFKVTCSKIVVTKLEKLFQNNEQKESFLDAIKKYPKNVTTKEEKQKYKLERITRDGVAIYYKLSDGSERYEFVVLPKETGYANSNLKKIIDINSLPMDTDLWIGKELRCGIDENNFPRLIK